MNAYGTALDNTGTTMVLSPESEFFRYFRNPDSKPQPGQPGAPATAPAAPATAPAAPATAPAAPATPPATQPSTAQ